MKLRAFPALLGLTLCLTQGVAFAEPQAADEIKKFDDACTRLASYDQTPRYQDLVDLVCSQGKALPIVAKVLKTPYSGSGRAKVYDPIKLDSDDGYTDMTVVGLTEYAMPVSQLIAASQRTMLAGAQLDDTSVETKFTSRVAVAAGSTDKHCYNLSQTIKSDVSFVTFHNEMKQIECVEYLPGLPNVAVVSRSLDPAAEHSDTKFYRHFYIFVQIDEHKTYSLSLVHLNISNMRFPSLTERRMKEVPPAIAAEFYKAVLAH